SEPRLSRRTQPKPPKERAEYNRPPDHLIPRETSAHRKEQNHPSQAYATTASPNFVPSLPSPPAAMTTNCLPSRTYDMRVACPPAGSSSCQRNLPASVANARPV